MGVNLLYPVLPALTDQFAVSDAEVALIIVVFTAPAIILAPLFGLAADIYGRRWLLIGGLVGFGATGGAVAFAPSFEWILVLRLFQGVAMSALSPLTIVLIGDLLEEKREISGQGMKVVIDRVALMVLPFAGGILALVSWRLPFLFYFMFTAMGLLAVKWFPETLPANNTPPKTYLGGVWKAVRRPRLMAAFSAGFLRFFLDYGFFTYFPLLLAAAYNVSSAESGLLLAFFGVGAIITAAQIGFFARFNRGRLLLGAFIVDGACLLLWPFLQSFVSWSLVLLVYGLANGLISPIQKNLLTQNAPTELRGGVISVDRLIQQTGKSLAPAVLGILLVTNGYSAVFWTLGILSLISVVFVALFLRAGKNSNP